MTNARRNLSRRRFLGAAIGVASLGAASLHLTGRDVRAAPQTPPRKVLAHDEPHRGAAFRRGRALGASLSAAGLRGPGAYEGPVARSPFPFTHAGIHWKGVGKGASFSARTSADGRRWGPWEPLTIEATPAETPRGQTYAALISASRHNYLQYRANIDDSEEIEEVTVTFLNATDGPELQTAAVTSTSGTPVNFTREQWGADPSYRYDSNGDELWPPMYVPHKKLVVHHTATSNTYDMAGAAAEVRAIHHYHAVTLGWGDIGYNALVDRFGRVFEGRYGRGEGADREVLSTGVVAGHALAHNYGSSGIAVVGTYTQRGEGGRPGIELSSATREALVDVLAFEANRNHIDPTPQSDFLLSDNTWNRGLDNISGHRDCTATVCPGGNIYSQLPVIRAAVASSLSRETPSVSLDAHPPEDAIPGGTVSYAWSSTDGVIYQFSLVGWLRQPNSEDIDYLHGYSEDPERKLEWSAPTEDTAVEFGGLPEGAYTFHLLVQDEEGRVGYQADRTVRLLGGDSEPPPDDEDPDDPPDDPPPPDEDEIALSVHAYKVRGLQKADLTWGGASTESVQVKRDGSVIATAPNIGSYTDNIDERGSGSYIYEVCEIPDDDAAVAACSGEVTATF